MGSLGVTGLGVGGHVPVPIEQTLTLVFAHPVVLPGVCGRWEGLPGGNGEAWPQL